MKAKVFVGTAAIVAAAFLVLLRIFVFSHRSSEANLGSNRSEQIASVQALSTSKSAAGLTSAAGLATSSTAKSQSHFYSPLRDPPPIPKPGELSKWADAYAALLHKGINPDMTTGPLASIYEEEAAKASKGDLQAAAKLFKGLLYCDFEPPPSSQQEVDEKIRYMTDTHTDADGKPTNNLDAAIARVREEHAYCAGLTESEKGTVTHWGWLAAQGRDPAIMAYAVAYHPPPSSFDPATIQQFRATLRSMVNAAARAGSPVAWNELYQGYYAGALSYPVDPVKAYATLYTQYMLTRSQYVAYEVWKASQRLSVAQIQAGEQLAQQYYKDVNSKN